MYTYTQDVCPPLGHWGQSGLGEHGGLGGNGGHIFFDREDERKISTGIIFLSEIFFDRRKISTAKNDQPKIIFD